MAEERFEHLEKAMCKELEKLDKKYTDDVEMSEQDAERARKLYHALKCAETYHAMKDAEEYEDDDEEEGYSGANRSYRRGGGRSNRGGSYRRGRDMRTGRYVSRGMDSYGYSSHYPMEYIDPMWDRRY